MLSLSWNTWRRLRATLATVALVASTILSGASLPVPTPWSIGMTSPGKRTRPRSPLDAPVC